MKKKKGQFKDSVYCTYEKEKSRKIEPITWSKKELKLKKVTIQVEPLKGYNFSSFRGKIAYKLNPISFR
ncbi:hypothetical protein, partial [Methanosarcina mazei]